MTSRLDSLLTVLTALAALRPDPQDVQARMDVTRGRAAELASAGWDIADDVAGEGRRRVHDAWDTVGPVVRRAVDDVDVPAVARRAAAPAIDLLDRRRRRRRSRRLLLIGAAAATAAAAVAAVLVARSRRARPAPEQPAPAGEGPTAA